MLRRCFYRNIFTKEKFYTLLKRILKLTFPTVALRRSETPTKNSMKKLIESTDSFQFLENVLHDLRTEKQYVDQLNMFKRVQLKWYFIDKHAFS